jgi:hypothetical protein
MRSFPPEPLRQYALLADGERGALVGPRGDIAFMCAPRWHDEGVFSSLIGGEGHYAVTPADPRFVWGGHYEEGTLIWRSRWVTTDGIIECREALAYPGDAKTAVLLRQIHAIEGQAVVDVTLDPRPGFGTVKPAWRSNGDGRWEAEGGGLYLRWSHAPAALHHRGSAMFGRLRLRQGQAHDLVLELSKHPLPGTRLRTATAWRQTESAWTGRCPRRADSLSPGDVTHSYALLRGLTSSDGGMVAAATTSLPERAEQGRNYDYRYAWIRDQCYAGHAAVAADALELAGTAADFVAARLVTDGPDLKPAYTVTGGELQDERKLDLPGYPGGTDIVGNRVTGQHQLDAFGEALLLFAELGRLDRLEPHHRRAADLAIMAIGTRGAQPDAGIWELDNERWAHSRLICAAGLRAYADAHHDRMAPAWVEQADALVAGTDVDCRHPTGRWQRAPGDDRVDASLLLPAIRGAVPAEDPRSVATWQAVRDELGRDGYVYRFRQQDGPLHLAEGAFLLCGFHMAMATHQQGDRVEAVRWFERSRGALGPPGLFTEEFDVVQRQLRGNLPQAFVHALLIESACRLHEPSTNSEENHS